MTLPIDWAYCAGFLDGEGTVTVKNKKGPRRRYGLQAHQNVREPLDVLQRILGGTVYGPYTRTRSTDRPGVTPNPYYVWRLSKQADVYVAMLGLKMYLTVKRAEVEIALEALESRFGN